MSARPLMYETAHPRVSGENGQAVWQMWLAWGSSPRERGKQSEMVAI